MYGVVTLTRSTIPAEAVFTSSTNPIPWKNVARCFDEYQPCNMLMQRLPFTRTLAWQDTVAGSAHASTTAGNRTSSPPRPARSVTKSAALA
jgi:hypothetical protein